MYDGALGKLFAGSVGLQSKDLLETPCVIELSDFAEESVSFLMNILLFKLGEILRQYSDSTTQQRIIMQNFLNYMKTRC